MATNNYQLLIEKLDKFIRKFYINQLIRGVLYSIAIIFALFITISVLEYNFYFAADTRKILFYSFLGISGLALFGWVLMPLMHYFRLGKTISHEQAAMIIGEHFANVKDKLLNILQLKKQSENNADAALINASINQKTQDLEPVRFRKAIDLSKNKKYLRFALPPLLLLFALLLIDANIIKDSTTRLINNEMEYERPAPFTFKVNNTDLTVVQFEDYDLEVEVEGDILPNEVFINVDDYEYKLAKVEKNKFTYKFSKVAKNTKFNLTASGFDSKKYELGILKKPNIVGFDVQLNYPTYTGRKNETLDNIGDLVVPEGTNIIWSFASQNTDNIEIQFSNNKAPTTAKRIGQENFTVKKYQKKDETYMVYISNELLPNADSVAYTISTIPDLHPNINVEQFQDSTQERLLFFVGDAGDDYGISQLTFNYRIEGENKSRKLNSTPMKVANPKNTRYEYTWDLEGLKLEPGDKLTYFFEVKDNDAVNGRKSARTSLMTYAIPTVEQFEQMEEENNEAIKDKLKSAVEESKQLQKDVQELKEKMLQKKDLDWQDRKEIEKLMERQKQLKENIEQAKQNFEENLKNQEQFEETKEEILEKQEQLQKLFEELMSDEMRELMQKMEELLQEMNKKMAMEELDDFEMNDEELEQELDRMLELFKQLEFEHELQQTVDKLNELAEEQEELSEKTKQDEQGKNQENLKKEQEKINEKFNDIKKKMEGLNKKNEELQNPQKMDDANQQQEEVEQDLNKASEQLQQKQNKKASDSQKNASDKMKDMANQMSMMMQSAQMQQMQEDIESLRQLLENLVTLSFDQEGLMKNMRKTRINTPKYVEQVQQQYKIKDDFGLVEDSLNALAKRVFQIESFVTEKVTDIKRNLKRGLEDLEERRKRDASVKQQRTMTGLNDLALMLSEVMEQMQQQMSGQMSGQQMCQKDGQGKPMMKLGDLQKQLNEQMKKMMEQMGKNPGQGKKGKGGKWSKEYAKMAAKQAAIRKALKELEKQKREQGKGDKGLRELIDKMDKTETDLVNKRLNNQMLNRQKEILTRLLEHAKAEREQEYDNERESKVGEKRERKMPPSLKEYLKKREAEIELYKSVSPSLKPYYKSLVEEYYKSLKNK